MTTEANDYVFAVAHPEFEMPTGLTKREYFAGLALQGLLAAETNGTPEQFARVAIASADALIKLLNSSNGSMPA